MKRLWVIFTLLFILSCEDKKDTTPPETTITSPSSGSTVNEMVNVTCMSTDNKEVSKVELWIDGVNSGLTDDTEPYSFQWNTTKYNDGDHTLIVRGYDTSDNEGDSPPVTVKVDNTVSVPNSISITNVNFSNGGFTIDWSKSSDGDFKSYTLEHSIESQMNDYEEIFKTEDVSVTSTRMENTSPLSYHYYRVTVTDTFLYQTKGSIFTSKLDPIPDSVDVDTVIYDLEKMTVKWGESKDSDFGSYKLLYSKTESGDKDTIETYTDKNTTSYSTTTYDPTIENWYWIMVSDTLGQSKIGNGKTNTVYSQKVVFTSDYKEYNKHQVYLMNIDGSNEIQLTNEQGYSPTFSPDGSKILYLIGENWDDRRIKIMDSDGGNQTVLTPDQIKDVDHPSFSPNGDKIVFMGRTPSWRQPSNIYIMNVDGSNQTKLTDTEFDDGEPKFSPNGDKIVFVSRRDGEQNDIFTMDVDGSNQTNLTNSNKINEYPSFSPDGSKIVFQRRVLFEHNDIYIMNSDGTNLNRLTTESPNWNPHFTPDGNKIHFISERDGNVEIYIMDVDGGNQTNLTNKIGGQSHPHISYDVEKIVYGDYLDGNWEIYIMDIDGSNQVRLTNRNGEDVRPQFQPPPKSN